MIRKKILISLCLTAVITACKAESIDNKDVEFAYLKGVNTCDLSNLIAVQLFDGYVAIPNTYYFSNRRSTTSTNEFSGDLTQGHSRGIITFGITKDLNLTTPLLSKATEKRVFEYSGKDIKQYRILGDFYATYIIGTEEYMKVFDKDKDYWKAIVDTSIILQEKKCLEY